MLPAVLFYFRDAMKRRRSLQLLKLSLFMLFLVYPNLSSIILSMFACKEVCHPIWRWFVGRSPHSAHLLSPAKVNGVSYVRSDFRVECGGAEWSSHVLLGVIFTLLYPIGIPLLFFSLMVKQMRQSPLSAPRAKLLFGFLYDAYESLWFFEIIGVFVCYLRGTPAVRPAFVG